VTTATRSTPSAAAAGRTLQLIRAGYGATLLLVPGPAIHLATGHAPSPRTCRTARLLGLRHLVQSALTAVVPLPVTFAIGGQVDTTHAASMLLLAAVSRPGRRAALTDALTEAAFAAAGFSVSVHAQPA
jgi:hypothetical protein